MAAKEKTIQTESGPAKKCTICKTVKLLIDFVLEKRRKDGLSCFCKLCQTQKNSDYWKKNRNKLKENVREWHKKQRIEHPERIIKQLEYSKKHYEENKVRKRELERINNLRPEVIARRKERIRERRKNDVHFRISLNLRGAVNSILDKVNCKKLTKMVEYLGCTVGEFKTHIESLFQPGMNWENHGKYDPNIRRWQYDHKIPCISFDLSKREEQLKCFHYSNIQPMWADENLRKNDKLPDGTRASTLKKNKQPIPENPNIEINPSSIL